MKDKELPLVGFTVLSQLSVGLCLAASVMLWNDSPKAGEPAMMRLFGASLAVLGLAMLVSLLHLGRPLGSVRALANLDQSWLSREIAAFGGFGLIVLVNLVAILAGMRPNIAGAMIAFFAGLRAVYASARIYATPSFPALNNGWPMAFFLVSAVILGPVVAASLAGVPAHSALKGWLVAALIAGLLTHLSAPLFWLRGARAMRASGADMLRAPLFWLRLVLGFALPLGVLAVAEGILMWLWALLLVSELAGRTLVFSHVHHTAETIGDVA